MDNLTRVRVMNILHEMESVIRNDSNLDKEQALELILSLDRFWDELKGDSQLEEKWQRASSQWRMPVLTGFTEQLHRQIFC
ncbi:MAG: hypothetical protein R3F46_07515 [bacterium]